VFEIYEEKGLRELLTRSLPYVFDKAEQLSLSVLSRGLSNGKLHAYDLVEEAETNGKFWQYGEPVTVEVDLPIHPGHEENYTDFIGKYCIERPWVCEVDDVKIMTGRGLMKKNGRWILESVGSPPQFLQWGIQDDVSVVLRDSLSLTEPETTEFHSRAFSLITRHNGNYGHWLFEDLPKVRALSEYEKVTGNRPQILIDDDATDWMVDSLDLLGLSSDRLYRWNGEHATVDSLVVPSAKWTRGFFEGYRFAPEDRNWVKEKLTAATEGVIDSPKRVFVSRQKWRRNINNFDEIKPILCDYGFSIVEPSTFSFTEQVGIFSDVDVIMGVSGSGLHNSLFASDTTVIEWKHPDADPILTPWYLSSEELGHRHVIVYGHELSSDSHKRVGNRCIDVLPEEMESVIQEYTVGESESNA